MTSIRALIIDDDADILRIAQLSLERLAGWTVTAELSGGNAVNLAISKRVDVVILDVQMPELDGPTIFNMLRANPDTAGIPVVMLTASVQAADHERFVALGADGILVKPFDPTRLAGQIEEILDGLK
ncbi:MAG: response regulator [Chloroflexi bacterium]|nr:response regulator [Chloroflexota bacterium]